MSSSYNFQFESKQTLISRMRLAIDNQSGFSMGKLGFAEQHSLLFFLENKLSESLPFDKKIRPLYLVLKYQFEYQSGIFPSDPEFMIEFVKFYQDQVVKTDVLGLFGSVNEPQLFSSLNFDSIFVPYQATEPDRSIPYNPDLCYLPLFRNKKLLFISPFSSFAKLRANQSTFESVWRSIGLPWFYPMEIQAIDIPYSYVNQKETHLRYKTSLFLYKEIVKQMDQFDFDIALIAAGHLGIPIANYAKSIGKIGLSLGGHFQVLFGILGERWNRDPYWKKNYINEHWCRLPADFIPINAKKLTDNHAYW